LTAVPEAGSPDVPFPVAAVPEDPDWLPPESGTGAGYDYWLGGCFL
jgi:hypothetical protein